MSYIFALGPCLPFLEFRTLAVRITRAKCPLKNVMNHRPVLMAMQAAITAGLDCQQFHFEVVPLKLRHLGTHIVRDEGS